MSIPYENRTDDFYFRDDGGSQHPLACGAHLHIHIELFYLISGRMRAFIDSTEYTVTPGDILISFPNQVHRFERVEPEEYLLFIVHPDLMPELSEVFAKHAPADAVIRHANDDPALLALLRMMTSLYRQTTGSAMRYRDTTLRGLLLAFFGQLLERMELTEPREEDSHAIRAIVSFCANHFSEDLSQNTLQEELHLSRYYISHLFSHKLNISFNEYINSLRISEACRLLRGTRMSVTDIAATVGFNTLRTFNRSFDKQMGRSPSAYRRAYAATAMAEDAVISPSNETKTIL